MKNKLYPLLFYPVYKDYLWGGNRINTIFNRDLPNGRYSESWEISDHKDGMSIVENGDFQGHTLKDLLEKFSDEIMGNNISGKKFPLLFKIIDAKKKLSVQVHPDNESSLKYGGEAKTEMWHILGENNSKIYHGFNKNIDSEYFLEAIKNNTVDENLNHISVKKNDSILVNGGTVHAIDEGCLLYEIQQSSNTTYRIYDWERLDSNGRSRELHIDEAIKIIKWNKSSDSIVKPLKILDSENLIQLEIINNELFYVDKLIFNESINITMNTKCFHVLFIIKGTVVIEWEKNKKINIPYGRSILVPACINSYQLYGSGEVLRTTIA